jgi:hypothetical protein
MSESNTDEIVEKKKISPEFVDNVKKYLSVDDKLRQLKEETKKLTAEKKNKEEFILNYLQTVDEKTIDVHDGKLRRNISKTQTPLKKETIQIKLTEVLGCSIKATSITDQIIKSRPFVERVTLKRTKNRTTDTEK